MLKETKNASKRLCIKVGRGHWDACVGTWDVGTRDEGLARTSSMGRGDVWDGDAGCEELLQKAEVNAISLSS